MSDYRKAIAAIRDQIAELSDDDTEERVQQTSLLAEWLAKAGQLVAARQEIGKVQTEAACQSDCIISGLKVNTLTGDRNAVITLLQKPVSKAERQHIGFYLNHDPELRPLLDDPQLSSTINLLLSSLQ